MLTLFPRIKPNPLPPPPLPPETLEVRPVLVEPVIDTAHPVVSAPDSEEAVAVTISPAEMAQPVVPESASPTSSVTNSDLFAAFMSGMVTGNSDPFIVEIGAQPLSKPVPELSESQQQPLRSASGTPGSAARVEEVSSKRSESWQLSGQDGQIAPESNAEPVPDALCLGEVPGDGLPAPQLYIAAANIFDELDILHEAATAPAEPAALPRQEAAPEPKRAPESTSSPVIEAASEATPEVNSAKAPGAPAPASESGVLAATEATAPEKAVPITADTAADSIELRAGPPNPAEEESVIHLLDPVSSSIKTACSDRPRAQGGYEPAALPQGQEAQASPSELELLHAPEAATAKPQVQQEVTIADRSTAESSKKAAFGVRLSPPKPKRAKGTFSGLVRVPEAEAMEDSGEVEAYASAAAQSHLDAIDDTFVAHAQLLLKGRERGRALDIGTGPGQIVIKLGYRLSLWKFIGIDRSGAMIEKARESLATAGELAGRVEFRVADGSALDFPDKTFDLVVCNSVLHHIAEPQRLLAEIARVVKPGGAILLRDLRRPSRWGYSYHVWKYGKYYAGEMRRLFMASVMAAYTEEELGKLVVSSAALRDVRVFHHGKTHIGFERPLATPPERKR